MAVSLRPAAAAVHSARRSVETLTTGRSSGKPIDLPLNRAASEKRQGPGSAQTHSKKTHRAGRAISATPVILISVIFILNLAIFQR